jgi:hypothetical protein
MWPIPVVMIFVLGQDTPQMRLIPHQGPCVPNIVSLGLIWGSAVVGGSAPAGSQDGVPCQYPCIGSHLGLYMIARLLSGTR